MENRHTYIGGSDIPAICGVGPITPIDKYLEKTQQIIIKPNLPMEIGKRLEPVIRALYLDYSHNLGGSFDTTFERECEDNWLFSNMEAVHPVYEFLKCHLDGWNPKTKKVLECKSTSNYVDTVPPAYVLQTAYNCALANADVGSIAVLSQTNTFQIFTYERNETLEKMIIDKACNFWYMMQTKTPPPVKSDEDISRLNQLLYKHVYTAPLQANEELKQAISDFKEVKDREKLITDEMREKKANLINLIAEYQEITDEHENLLLTYRYNSVPNYRIDSKKLKEEFPDVYEQVVKENTPTRQLRIK